MRVLCSQFGVMLTVLLGCLSAVQQVPSSPCPAYFNYSRSGGGPLGHIVLPAGGSGDQVLRVRLSLKAKLPESYKGEIEFVEAKEGSIWYIVRFPLQSPLPKVTSISYNSEILCKGEPEILDGANQTVTNFSLQYTQVQQTTPRSPNAGEFEDSEKDIFGKNLSSSHPYSSNQDFACGVPKPTASGFVVAGTKTEAGDWPWLVTVNLRRNRKYQCTGVLLSPHLVITASHCVMKGKIRRHAEELFLQLGVFNKTDATDKNTVERNVSRISVPPGNRFARPPIHDLAALTLAQPVTFTDRIIPICMWSGNKDLTSFNGDKKKGSVVGWGKYEADEESSEIPRLLELPIVAVEDCRNSHMWFVNIVKGRQFCTGTRDGKSGLCSGDSGAGMFVYCDRYARWELRGLVSYGARANNLLCDLTQYVVITDLTYRNYVTWINGVINEEKLK